MNESPPTAPPDATTRFGAFLLRFRAFRQEFLEEGTDFGVIPNIRDAKPTLLKPGSEKIARWLDLRFHFEADQDSWVQAGSIGGTICYLCYLIDPQGEIVGEGRGSAAVQEKKTINNTIKAAEKRAQVDAILRYGCLSAEFSQDLEDEAPAPKPAPAPAPASVDPDGLPDPAAIRDLQLKQIRALLARLGKSEADYEAKNLRGRALTSLSAIEAQKVIDWCQAQIKRKGQVSA